MISTLRLEAIGANYPWVARIVRLDGDSLVRKFVNGSRDYRDANSTGSRGVYLTFVLREPSVYEVHERLSWSKSRRYFCCAERGGLIDLSLNDVRSRLSDEVSVNALQKIINAMVRA